MNKTEKISDVLVNVNENINIHMYNNGYMVELNGRNHGDDYETVKLICTSLEEVFELIGEANSMPKNN